MKYLYIFINNYRDYVRIRYRGPRCSFVYLVQVRMYSGQQCRRLTSDFESSFITVSRVFTLLFFCEFWRNQDVARLQQAVDALVNWASLWQLSISVNKLSLIHI